MADSGFHRTPSAEYSLVPRWRCGLGDGNRKTGSILETRLRFEIYTVVSKIYCMDSRGKYTNRESKASIRNWIVVSPKRAPVSRARHFDWRFMMLFEQNALLVNPG